MKTILIGSLLAPLSRRACFAAAFLGLGLLLLALPLSEAGTMTEPSSGVEFALERSVPGETGTLELTGVGIRKKFFFKVYAFGLYVDGEAARSQLASFKGKSSDQLRGDDAVYQALMGLDGDQLVVMKFTRSVGAAKMRGALADVLERGVPTDDPAGKAFLALWDEVIENGEEVLISFSAGGEVRVFRHGKERGRVQSPKVARALLESWLGKEPVSSSIKAGAVQRLPEIL